MSAANGIGLDRLSERGGAGTHQGIRNENFISAFRTEAGKLAKTFARTAVNVAPPATAMIFASMSGAKSLEDNGIKVESIAAATASGIATLSKSIKSFDLTWTKNIPNGLATGGSAATFGLTLGNILSETVSTDPKLKTLNAIACGFSATATIESIVASFVNAQENSRKNLVGQILVAVTAAAAGGAGSLAVHTDGGLRVFEGIMATTFTGLSSFATLISE